MNPGNPKGKGKTANRQGQRDKEKTCGVAALKKGSRCPGAEENGWWQWRSWE